MESKPAYLSKTVWTNLILMVILPFLPESAKSFVTPENVSYLFVAVNFLLRIISKDKVTLW